MIKALAMFIFGNALWEKLVEIFGSTEAVVDATLWVLALLLILKFFKQLIILAAVIFVLWYFFH